MNNTALLFNKIVIGKFLDSCNSDDVAEYAGKYAEILKWKKAADEGRTKKAAEEEVKGPFLERVFGKVLGYHSIASASEKNRQDELKTKLDSTKPDSSLGFFAKNESNVCVVVELKDASTNLDKRQGRTNHQSPVEQAFSYAHKHGSGCKWVIVSNFIEIRLYHATSSLEYELFMITDLDKEEKFKRFYFLLCKENLIARQGKSIVDKLYDVSELAHIEITNKFYCDYKNLRTDLYDALKQNNTAIDQFTLFGKAQKILDRFLFVCFCESTFLLPGGVFKQVIQSVKSSFIMSPNRLWNELKGLFHSIDKGNPPMQINGYNGGLFAYDEILDNLVIPDNVLENFQNLTEYDFASDLNVNILGHIFEHSLADIEQIKAEIAGKKVDRAQSKQKADGIFYTPDYVTKFIIEKTIGRWLTDERARIRQSLFDKGNFIATGGTLGKRKIAIKKWEEIPDEVTKDDGRFFYLAVIRLHETFWDEYINRLKTIRIIDPACGSGAFLNCAFDYLAKEGRDAVEMRQSLASGQMTIIDWDRHILQNNLYGVDLNAESVEITKLSLWLKTARKDRELAELDENIKYGNSIINDPAIAGDKAFDWKAEFSEIMASGGFDVVIGNPPYGANLTQAEKDYIASNYDTSEGRFNTYKTFFELGFRLLKPDGYIGYITPNTFLVLENGASKLRETLYTKNTLLDLVELYNVFPTAVVEPVITVLKKSEPKRALPFQVMTVPREVLPTSEFIGETTPNMFEYRELLCAENLIFNYRASKPSKILRHKLNNLPLLRDYFGVYQGIIPYGKGEGKPPQTAEIVKNKPYTSYSKHSDEWYPYTRGKHMNRYLDAWDGEYLHYGAWLCRPRVKERYMGEKLFMRQTSDYPIATYDNTCKFSNHTLHCIVALSEDNPLSIKYLLGLLNSKFMRWVFQHDNFTIVGQPLPETKVVFVERLPIVVTNDQKPVIDLVEKLLSACQSRHDMSKAFMEYIKAIHKPYRISERMQDFCKHDFAAFISELKKQKVKLTAKQEMELMPLYEEKKSEVDALSQTINRLDDELDEIVFELYGITSDERKIVF